MGWFVCSGESSAPSLVCLGERSALQAAQDRRPGASGEPVAKYNRLIEIEADTNLAYGLR
jgi:hypothetical protein